MATKFSNGFYLQELQVPEVMWVCFCQWLTCPILGVTSSPCSRVIHNFQQEATLPTVVTGLGDGLIYSVISETLDSASLSPLGTDVGNIKVTPSVVKAARRW